MTIELNSKLISSAKISLLLGSGTNGKLFPQLKDFKNTIRELKRIFGRQGFDSAKVEQYISGISDKTKKEHVFGVFKKEILRFNKEIDFNNKSYLNICNLFTQLDRLIQFEENRTNRTKQVNIFTLNYDTIIEGALERSGLFYNVLNPENVQAKSYLYSLVGQDYHTKMYKTTFLISKIHGTIEKPILPGLAKYDELLADKYYEMLFNMKSILKQPNAVLFVIGYSGNDKHINQLISDCSDSGLSIFWLRYDKNESIPQILINKVRVLDQENEKVDSTKLLSEGLEKLWEKGLE